MTRSPDASEARVRRQLALRREISAQRTAIKRARAHGEAPQAIARLANTLRQLMIEMDDLTHTRYHDQRAS